MNHLDFKIYKNENGHQQTQILIDGEDLLSILDAEKKYIDLDPLLLLFNIDKNGNYFDYYSFLNRDEKDRTIIYCCGCQQFECDLIYTDIIIKQGSVIWNSTKARLDRVLPQTYPFEFSQKNYRDCLKYLRENINI